MRLRVDKFGRLVIPKAMRKRKGMEPGAAVEVEESAEGLHLVAVREEPTLIRKNGVLMSTAKPLVDLDDAVQRDRQNRERHILGLSQL